MRTNYFSSISVNNMVKSMVNPRNLLVIKETLAILTEDEKEAYIMRNSHNASYLSISKALGYPGHWIHSLKLVEQATEKIEKFIEATSIKD